MVSWRFNLQGAFIDQHYDQDLNFHATEEDPVTKKVLIGFCPLICQIYFHEWCFLHYFIAS